MPLKQTLILASNNYDKVWNVVLPFHQKYFAYFPYFDVPSQNWTSLFTPPLVFESILYSKRSLSVIFSLPIVLSCSFGKISILTKGRDLRINILFWFLSFRMHPLQGKIDKIENRWTKLMVRGSNPKFRVTMWATKSKSWPWQKATTQLNPQQKTYSKSNAEKNNWRKITFHAGIFSFNRSIKKHHCNCILYDQECTYLEPFKIKSQVNWQRSYLSQIIFNSEVYIHSSHFIPPNF